MPSLAGRPVDADSQTRLVQVYGHLFEYSPWVVQRAWAKRPFKDAAALHHAFLQVLAEAAPGERLALAVAHPELADKVSIARGLTEDSAREQASAGLDRLSVSDYALFHDLNRAYRKRHGFPFIICVKLHDKDSILSAMAERLERPTDTELDEAMTQIGLISQLRMADVKVDPESRPPP